MPSLVLVLHTGMLRLAGLALVLFITADFHLAWVILVKIGEQHARMRRDIWLRLGEDLCWLLRVSPLLLPLSIFLLPGRHIFQNANNELGRDRSLAFVASRRCLFDPFHRLRRCVAGGAHW